MAGDLGAYQLLFVGKERASSLSENRRTSTHKTAKDTEREKKKERSRAGRGSGGRALYKFNSWASFNGLRYAWRQSTMRAALYKSRVLAHIFLIAMRLRNGHGFILENLRRRHHTTITPSTALYYRKRPQPQAVQIPARQLQNSAGVTTAHGQ